MKIKTLEIQNYRAIHQSIVLDFDGKDVLIYGENGSGKSSVAQAIQVFLSHLSTDRRHLMRGDDLCQLHLGAHDTKTPFVVNVVAKEDESPIQWNIQINKSGILEDSEKSRAMLRLSHLTAETMSYRALMAFSNFDHEEDINFLSVFVKEIFPYWSAPDFTDNLSKLYREAAEEINRLPQKVYSLGSTRRNQILQQEGNRVNQLNGYIARVISGINIYLQSVLESLWGQNNFNIKYEYSICKIINEKYFEPGKIKLELTINGQKIVRPQSYLNESRLTSLALATRIAMRRDGYQDSASEYLRLLILDDLLLSLDMNNRISIFKVLYEEYKDYQKIIFTHDKGLYEVLRNSNSVYNKEKSWKYIELYGNGMGKSPTPSESKKTMTKAQEASDAKDWEITALYLRRRCEELLNVLYEKDLDSLKRYTRLNGTLNEGLKGVKDTLEYQRKRNLFKILDNVDLEEADYATLQALQIPAGGPKVTRLLRNLSTPLKEYHEGKAHKQKLVEDIEQLAQILNEMRGRVLNNGAHANEGEPMFELEVRGALSAVKEFEQLVLELKEKDK